MTLATKPRLTRGITLSAEKVTPPRESKIRPMHKQEGMGLGAMIGMLVLVLFACAVGFGWWMATS